LFQIALQQTEYLSNEKSFIPWKAALQGLSYINLMLTDKTSGENSDFKEYLIGILLPIYTELGFSPMPEDSHMKLQTRKLILTWLCKMGHEVTKNGELIKPLKFAH
jgi:aminopeptidase N